MTGLIQPFLLIAREAGDATRAALRRTLLVGAALLIAASGAGFLTLATYLALRRPLGPELAALALGVALAAVSAGLILAVRAKAQRAGPLSDPRQSQPANATPTPADAATMAVFMVAFLIGRRLADRWDQTRQP